MLVKMKVRFLKLPEVCNVLVSFFFSSTVVGFYLKFSFYFGIWKSSLMANYKLNYSKNSCISRTFLPKFWVKNRGCGLYTRPLLSVLCWSLRTTTCRNWPWMLWEHFWWKRWRGLLWFLSNYNSCWTLNTGR